MVFRTVDNGLVATINGLGTHPEGIAITPNGQYAYVTKINFSEVSVISTASNAVVGGPIIVGNQSDAPQSIAVTSDGRYVYVANYLNNTVSVISTASNTVIATIEGFSNPASVAIRNSIGKRRFPKIIHR